MEVKAAHYTQYGGPEVFSVIEKPKPTPSGKDILVKVHCTTVNRTDTGMTSAMYFVSRAFTGLIRPRQNTPGTDFSGVVEEVGPEVNDYRPGDEVFGFNDQIIGSQAEYVLVSNPKFISHKPQGVGHDVAVASIEGAHYALNMFRYANVNSGGRVLVYGATGAIGSAAVQLASRFGAGVDAVGNTPNIEMIRGLGAEKVWDYLTEDFTESNEKYDFICDAVGKSSYKACKPLLKPKGTYISSELGKNGINIWLALTSRRVKFPFPSQIKNSLEVMKKLVEMGKFAPVIDRTYPLDDIQEAYRYVTSGQKTGNVVLNIV